MSSHQHQHQHQHSGGAPHDETAEAAFAELLDLDAEVLHSYWADVLTWVHEAATTTGTGCRRILDLGAGTGTGTIALARRFGGAEVVAVDSSEDMLRRIQVKALDLDLVDRIRTVQADLDVGWPSLDPVDLTWASMSLHHLSDPDQVLGNVRATTRPGGLVAVVEFTEPLRFLPDELGVGRPGLETRCLDAWSAEHAEALPELGSDWGSRLAAAGFTLRGERTFAIDLTARDTPGAARYAQHWFRRLGPALAHRLAQDDAAALAGLIDGDGPESLRHRDDLRVRGTRTVTLAQRP